MPLANALIFIIVTNDKCCIESLYIYIKETIAVSFGHTRLRWCNGKNNGFIVL